jgi:hypothetical protein
MSSQRPCCHPRRGHSRASRYQHGWAEGVSALPQEPQGPGGHQPDRRGGAGAGDRHRWWKAGTGERTQNGFRYYPFRSRGHLHPPPSEARPAGPCRAGHRRREVRQCCGDRGGVPPPNPSCRYHSRSAHSNTIWRTIVPSLSGKCGPGTPQPLPPVGSASPGFRWPGLFSPGRRSMGGGRRSSPYG